MTRFMHESALKDFTEDQQACIKMLGDWACGFHHLPFPSQFVDGVSIHWSQDLSTHDFDRLTALVVLAHERCCRVEIKSGGPRGVTIAVHRRDPASTSICRGHPTIQDLAARLYRHPADMLEAARRRFSAWRLHYLKFLTPVVVDCDRYRGPGTADVSPIDQDGTIAVQLQNGNVWNYPAQDVWPAEQIPGALVVEGGKFMKEPNPSPKPQPTTP
jgi:hypothetical protein